MELNTKGRYAVMAMAELAHHASDTALPLSQIAEQQKLPLPYLEQLFLQLRRAGLVESARGRSGGYRLARSSADISIADVMSAVEEETHFTRCSDEAHGCLGGERCITHGLWQGLSDVTASYLKSVTLQDVAASKGQSLNRASGRASERATGRYQTPRVYLDYNATAPLHPDARKAMIAALDVTGNASSVHGEGRRARGIVEAAREDVARLVGAKASEVVFTSGATEANAWVMAQGWDTIFVSGIEHDSVLAPAKASGANIIEIPVGADGVARISEVARHAQSGVKLGRTLVVLQMANNETGVIQPVAEFAILAREQNFSMHVDAVQAAGRLPIDFASLGVTTLSLSGHKMGGPKGVGALLIRDHVDLVPFVRGGGQERRRRAGTENIAAIAGFGAAAVQAHAALVAVSRIVLMRDQLEAEVRKLSPNALIIGADAPRLANTAAIALPGKHAESMVIKLDLAGIAVSAGAACSSGKVGTSHVLQSMGFGADIAGAAIRVSLGPETTEHDIAAFIAAWKTIVSQSALAA